MFFSYVDFNVPLDKQDPHIIMNTACVDAAQQNHQEHLEVGAKSVVLCSHLGPNGEEIDVSSAPVAKVVEEAWQARAADEDPASNAKLTGMSLCAPTTEASFMLVIVCAETRRRSEVTRKASSTC